MQWKRKAGHIDGSAQKQWFFCELLGTKPLKGCLDASDHPRAVFALAILILPDGPRGRGDLQDPLVLREAARYPARLGPPCDHTATGIFAPKALTSPDATFTIDLCPCVCLMMSGMFGIFAKDICAGFTYEISRGPKRGPAS